VPYLERHVYPMEEADGSSFVFSEIILQATQLTRSEKEIMLTVDARLKSMKAATRTAERKYADATMSQCRRDVLSLARAPLHMVDDFGSRLL
jgi:hypothetical protein